MDTLKDKIILDRMEAQELLMDALASSPLARGEFVVQIPTMRVID